MKPLRFRVGKLIRDGLPAIMRAQGLAEFEHRMDDAAYRQAAKSGFAKSEVWNGLI